MKICHPILLPPTYLESPPRIEADIAQEVTIEDREESSVNSNDNEVTTNYFRTIVMNQHVQLDPRLDNKRVDNDEFFMGDYLTNSNYNPMDQSGLKNDDDDDNVVPPIVTTTDTGQFPYTILDQSKLHSVPCHVLLNPVGVLCTQYNNRIYGTHAQKNFIQRIVFTICGMAHPKCK